MCRSATSLDASLKAMSAQVAWPSTVRMNMHIVIEMGITRLQGLSPNNKVMTALGACAVMDH
jgi:hypothetical protein